MHACVPLLCQCPLFLRQHTYKLLLLCFCVFLNYFFSPLSSFPFHVCVCTPIHTLSLTHSLTQVAPFPSLPPSPFADSGGGVLTFFGAPAFFLANKTAEGMGLKPATFAANPPPTLPPAPRFACLPTGSSWKEKLEAAVEGLGGWVGGGGLVLF